MSEVAPLTQSSPLTARRVLPGLLLGSGALAIAAVNPTDSGAVICGSRLLFGVDCPACGGLRCVNALVRGDFLAAADHNVILAIALPLIALTWIAWLLAPLFDRQVRVIQPPRWAMLSAVIVVTAFSVLRNVDGPGWVTWLASGTFT